MKTISKEWIPTDDEIVFLKKEGVNSFHDLIKKICKREHFTDAIVKKETKITEIFLTSHIKKK